MSPTPKPERSAAAPRKPARVRGASPPPPGRPAPRSSPPFPRSAPGRGRHPSWSGWRIASGRSAPNEEVMPRISAKPSASPTRAIPWPNKSPPMPQANPNRRDLGQHRAGRLLKHPAQMRNRGQRDDPGENQQSRNRIDQPDVLPTPGGKPLHGGGETAVEHASHKNQHQAPANLMTHNSSCGIAGAFGSRAPAGSSRVSATAGNAPGKHLPAMRVGNQDDGRRAGAVTRLIRRT